MGEHLQVKTAKEDEHMIKKWFAAGTIGVALTLSACGSDTSDSPGETAETTAADGVEQAEQEVGEAEETEQAEESGDVSEAGKRSNPVALGETKVVDIVLYDNDSNEYAGTAEITINSVMRGEEAWDYAYGVNEFNEEPPEGQEYVIADVTAKLTEAETEDYAWFLSSMNFDFIGSDGSPYDWTSIVVEPELSGEIYEGGTLEGKLANMVKTDDPILLVFEDGNWDNVFFATEE